MRALIGSDFSGAQVRLQSPGADFWVELGNKIWIKVFIGLVRNAKEVADELPEPSPEMRVSLHAERYANCQHQEARFQLVHGWQLLLQLVCQAFPMSCMSLAISQLR
jgi:hypothetical protein